MLLIRTGLSHDPAMNMAEIPGCTITNVEDTMKKIAAITVMVLCFSLGSGLIAGISTSKQRCACRIPGGITVDSLFSAIQPACIGIKPEFQKAKPSILDRKNGYMCLTYDENPGNTVEYIAALYTAGKKNDRVFLMVTRSVKYIAQLPSTENFWIFEYVNGTCIEKTDSVLPAGKQWSIIRLPQKGTDLECCEMKGTENGIAEECTTYSWDLMKGEFKIKK
jgi:hypothetical protein